MSDFDDKAEADERDAKAWLTEADLTDAADELALEKAERAMAWERAWRRVKEARNRMRSCPFVYFSDVKHYETHNVDELLAALRELEQLEQLEQEDI